MKTLLCRFETGAVNAIRSLLMSDDPFYTPGLKLPPRQRRPGELHWTVRKDHVTWTCELFFRGEGYGWGGPDFPRDGFEDWAALHSA